MSKCGLKNDSVCAHLFSLFVLNCFFLLRCCEKTMEVMRSSQEALLTIVEVQTAYTQTQHRAPPQWYHVSSYI